MPLATKKPKSGKKPSKASTPAPVTASEEALIDGLMEQVEQQAVMVEEQPAAVQCTATPLPMTFGESVPPPVHVDLSGVPSQGEKISCSELFARNAEHQRSSHESWYGTLTFR